MKAEQFYFTKMLRDVHHPQLRTNVDFDLPIGEVQIRMLCQNLHILQRSLDTRNSSAARAHLAKFPSLSSVRSAQPPV
jgi:hypothetical protein